MKPAGNHQMQDQPKIFFESDADAFTQASQLHNLSAFNAPDCRHGRAQQKRRRDLHALECLILNALLQRFEVDDDVR